LRIRLSADASVQSQARHIEGLHVMGVAGLDVGKARASLARVGWSAEQYGTPRSPMP
jgi:predicted homoserine dehydrogenase-like protein